MLVGHDLGGGVAQIAAVRALDRFAGLMLTDAVCYDSWPIPSGAMMQRVSGPLSLLPEVLLYPTFVQLMPRGHDDPAMAREAIGEHWAPYVTHGAAPSMMRQMAALEAADTQAVADALPTLGLPAWVVWGEADRSKGSGTASGWPGTWGRR